MFAPLIDMPIGVSSASGQYRRPEYVINTPYHKVNEDSRFQYRFIDGFYESAESTFTSPLVELRRNEVIRHVQQILDRWNTIVPEFANVHPKVVVEVISKLLTALIGREFTKITFEKTPDNSLLTTGEWQGKLVYVDVFFDEEEPDGYEAILNVYEQKRPALTVAGTLDAVFDSLFEDSQKRQVHSSNPSPWKRFDSYIRSTKARSCNYMSYPERLLPQATYKYLDLSLLASRSYYLTRHTDSPQITNEEGRLKADYVVFQTDHLRDYSTNLLGEFVPSDVCWNWLKGTQCTDLWQVGEAGILPVLDVDVELVQGRGSFYLAIYQFHNISFSPGEGTEPITCRVLHTPTRGNFWHCSLRWWQGDDKEDVSTWGDDKKGQKRRRLILSSARTFIITNAILSEPSYQAVPPEAYNN